MVRALPFAHTERGDMQRVNHLWILAPLLAAACGGGAPESQQCSSLQGGSPIAAVRSSGGAPDLAVDGNPATSWSCSGACWIDLDLGSVRQRESRVVVEPFARKSNTTVGRARSVSPVVRLRDRRFRTFTGPLPNCVDDGASEELRPAEN